MTNFLEIQSNLMQLTSELEVIAQKDLADMKQNLDTLERELHGIERKEVEYSADSLCSLSSNLRKIERKKFSILKVLKIEKNENVHSNFLAWLLEPTENHGLGTMFVDEFLKVIERKVPKFSGTLALINTLDILVEREVSNETSRLDIRLMDTKGFFHCTIENKISSAEGADQTNRLYNDFHGICAHEMFIFLTLNGKEKPINKNFLTLTYIELLPILLKIESKAVDDTKLLIINYVNTIERLIMADKFNGYSERTQLYFRYEKQISEVKAAYEEDRRLLLSSLEDGIKKRQWWDESSWKITTTGSIINVWKSRWWQDPTGFYIELRPWIEQPAVELFIYGTPATFSAKFVHILKKNMDKKYPGKIPGDFIKHLTGVNKFIEKIIRFLPGDKDQTEKVLNCLDQMVNQFEKILDESIEDYKP